MLKVAPLLGTVVDGEAVSVSPTLFVPLIVTLPIISAFSIVIVYVASFVAPEFESVAVITIVYVPDSLFADIVITPALDTVIPDSPDFCSAPNELTP